MSVAEMTLRNKVLKFHSCSYCLGGSVSFLDGQIEKSLPLSMIHILRR